MIAELEKWDKDTQRTCICHQPEDIHRDSILLTFTYGE